MSVPQFETTVTYCRSSIHNRVLAHEPCFDIIEDDELHWLVNPSVTETELNTLIGRGDSTMPQATRKLDDIRGFLGIKADDECRGMDVVDDAGVVRVGA